MGLQPICWFENQDSSGSFTKVAAADRFDLNISGDEIEMPSDSAGIAMMAHSTETAVANVRNFRTDIASLREPTDIYSSTINAGDLNFGAYPFPHHDVRDSPYSPGTHENMEVEVQQTGAPGATDDLVTFMLAPSNERSIPSGPRRRIFFDADTSSLTSGQWNRVSISLDQTLINGNYEVIGGHFYSSDAVLFGVDFEDQTFVAGGFAGTTPAEEAPPFQQAGMLGRGWGQFRDDAPPDILTFVNGTTDDGFGYLDIVGPTGGGA